MARHALIGGGTGFVGTRLAKHLAGQGYEVTVVSRMPGLKRITWHQLEKDGLPKGVTSVVNLAGQNVLDPSRRWTAGFKQNVWNSRINSGASLVKAIEKAGGVEAFVNISGVSHYPPNENKVYTENDEVQGFDFMSRLCLEWEKAATLPDGVQNVTRGVKLRTGVVVGREGGMIQSIWIPFNLGVGGPMGTGKQILPWIHLEDLCRLIQHCLENKECKGVFNAVAPDIVTNGEFSKTFASALHRPCLFAVPEFVVDLMFGKDRSALLLSGAKIEPKHALDTGFEFKYPTAKLACQEVVKKQ
ncbi:epimerase family protein SDR39U1 [Musca domestica]|uniref:Epimerase family protein SDR39U1 n=1 Tax=Musca domestica TaxID=7370 RepID=T1PFU0_MUSDO|nr:epimerase family protein SDR39U1 [Musca domestica]